MNNAPSVDTVPSTGGAFTSAGLNHDENNRISTMKELRTMVKIRQPKKQSVYDRLNADGQKYAERRKVIIESDVYSY
jgi:hypothetical protein